MAPKTVSKVTDPGAPLTTTEYELVTYVEQFALQYGHLPNAADLEAADFSRELFYKCIGLSKFNRALELRGITPYAMLNQNGKIPVKLTPRQLEAANAMMDLMDTRSDKKKLADLGISTNEWASWLRSRTFNSYIAARAEWLLKDSIHDGHRALLHSVRNGDVSAIKLFYEITGRFVPSNTKGVDVQEILFKVMEVIQKTVSDPVTQAAIARELIQLAEPSAAQFDGSAISPVGTLAIDSGIIEGEVVEADEVEVKPSEPKIARPKGAPVSFDFFASDKRSVVDSGLNF